MNDPRLQQQMLLIARGYEKLAEYVARVTHRNMHVGSPQSEPVSGDGSGHHALRDS
jgi:hypothetical protein